MKIVALSLAFILGFAAVSEAGLFRKRNGDRRAPVRNTLRAVGGCLGSCGR